MTPTRTTIITINLGWYAWPEYFKTVTAVVYCFRSYKRNDLWYLRFNYYQEWECEISRLVLNTISLFNATMILMLVGMRSMAYACRPPHFCAEGYYVSEITFYQQTLPLPVHSLLPLKCFHLIYPSWPFAHLDVAILEEHGYPYFTDYFSLFNRTISLKYSYWGF